MNVSFNVFQNAEGNNLYNMTFMFSTDSVLSIKVILMNYVSIMWFIFQQKWNFTLKDNLLGEVAFGASNKYEKLFNIANDRCKGSKDLIGSFATKLIYHDIEKYTTTNTTNCPFKKVNFQWCLSD